MEDTQDKIECPSCGADCAPDAEVCLECEFPLTGDRSPFQPGVILESRYRIDAEVGRGGMGVVYRGTDLTLSRPIAIKAMLASRADAGVLARFMHEARSLASVEHPRLVPVYAVGQEQGVYYMVMKFVEGEPLSDLLMRGECLDEATTKRLVVQVCGALDVLHKNQLIHRDLKPANLIIGPDGSFTVMDLGIAKSTDETATSMANMTGTPRYMAPEMFSDAEVDGRTDLYALGIVAYHVLTGLAPFDGPTPMSILYKQAHVEAEPIRSHLPSLSKGMADVITRLMKKDASARFASAVELRDSVQSLELGQTKTASMAPLGLLILVCLGIGAYFFGVGAPSAPVKDSGATEAVVQDAAVPEPVIRDAATPPDAAPQLVEIQITSQPGGAAVYHGKERLGTTPLKIKRPLDTPSMRLSIRKTGFQSKRLRVRFQSPQTFRATLNPEFQLVP